MQQVISIKSASDALALFDNIDSLNIDDIDFSHFESFTIKLRGKNYKGTITPPIMDGFKEYQKSIHRAYALIKNGNDNIQALTKSERDALQIAVGVAEGSSGFTLPNGSDILDVFKAAVRKMTGKQIMCAIIIVAALYFGKEGFAIWIQHQAELKKIDAGTFAQEQETSRLNAVVKIAEGNTILMGLIREADRAHNSIVSGSLDADTLEIDGRAISRETAEQIIKEPEPEVVQARLDGMYRVLSMNFGNDNQVTVRLLRTDGFAFSAKIENLILKHHQEEIQKTIFDRESVSLKINARLRAGEVLDAFIVAAGIAQ